MSIHNVELCVLRISIVLLLFIGQQDVIANEKEIASDSINGKKLSNTYYFLIFLYLNKFLSD